MAARGQAATPATPTTAAPDPASAVQLRVKIGMAASSGKLDLSECGLQRIPDSVWDLTGLEELSLHGNPLEELPEEVGRLTSLRRLQLSSCGLHHVPASICNLTNLEGLWMLGNLVTELPADIGALTPLRMLVVHSNCLTALPDSITALSQLTDLGAAGNRLGSLPDDIGALGSLQKLMLNGNCLQHLPTSIGNLRSLQELFLQCNLLESLPDELLHLTSLHQLNLAENNLISLPECTKNDSQTGWVGLTQLQELWVYSNHLQQLPQDLLSSCHALRNLWLEGNPLDPNLLRSSLQAPAHEDSSLRALGIDQSQMASLGIRDVSCLRNGVRTAEVCAARPGYWKLERGPAMPCDVQGEQVLVVTFASAPGTPNWGKLLSRVRRSADQPAHNCFDILYVVDGARAWYEGGEEAFHRWHARLASVTQRYNKVLFLGDSMGAAGALLFSDLATAVHAFSPQVELNTASLRPSQDENWANSFKMRLLAAVDRSPAVIDIYCSNWSCDLAQARLIPSVRAKLHIYEVDSHRLALYMDGAKLLLPAIKKAIVQQMGLWDAAADAALLAEQIKKGPFRLP
ncbi:hypothetical protein WJX74_007529 [Apatococcus lobatus]|uniref:Disease resistance R13L4/SHOC-2-like LRR domain-containing protein n=1 Tax=Apatococcus lobatus TaxID=904363 RepID=A0AAW1Q940_9CHLO